MFEQPIDVARAIEISHAVCKKLIPTKSPRPISQLTRIFAIIFSKTFPFIIMIGSNAIFKLTRKFFRLPNICIPCFRPR